MPRRALLSVALVATVALTPMVVGGGVAAAAPPEPAVAEAEFLQLLNQQRASAGKRALVLDPALSSVARAWSGRMVSAGFAHNPSLRAQVEASVTREWTRLGENIGLGGSVASLHAAFWRSPGHRANLLGAFNRVGIGVVNGPDGSMRVTVDFLAGPSLVGVTGVGGCALPGHLLEAYGGVHAVGGAPALAARAHWPGWDVARDLAVAPGTGGGQVLDAFGGLHPAGTAPRLGRGPYWAGWDVARAVAVTPGGAGAYVLDAFGGVHAAGNAPRIRTGAYWRGWDIARDIQLDATGSAGYVLDGLGGLHPFGGMAPARLSWYSTAGGARSLSLRPDGLGGWVTDSSGSIHPFTIGSAPMPPGFASPLPPSSGNMAGSLTTGTAAVVVTASGARVGIGTPCADPAPWPGRNLVRAVVGA